MLEFSNLHALHRKYYTITSNIAPFKKIRWGFTSIFTCFYLYRVSGLCYDVITYLIGFYLIHLLVGYITPKGLEDIEDENEEEKIEIEVEVDLLMREDFDLEQKTNSEKPLIASINEPQIWIRISLAIILGSICTFFQAIEIEVFWPLLMVYFVILVGYTLNKIIKKMKKYRYSLSDFNKQVPNLQI